MCPTSGASPFGPGTVVNGTCTGGVCSPTAACANGPGTCFINGTCGTAATGCPYWGLKAPVSGYFANSPAPCWANTAPTSYAIPANATAWNGYSVADTTGSFAVPHFLDYSSVLYKDVNGRVHRQAVPPGACLPGNLLNVRTSDVQQYYAAVPSVQPVFPTTIGLGGPPGFPTGANQIFSTTNDKQDQSGLTTYTPGSQQAPVNNTGNGGQPATMGSIRVYFSLNFGLRNALDNACDGRNASTTAACVNGGYYVSNLTTALLGDASKGLGPAKYALIKLCHSPMSTLDRPWRKRAGDAINNKQCQDVKQLLFGADVEAVDAAHATALAGDGTTPMALLAAGGSAMLVQPVPAQTGLAVNGVQLTGFTDGNLFSTNVSSPSYGQPTAVKPPYASPAGVATPSPVAFCRPAASALYASGVNPSKAAGVQFTNASYCLNTTIGGVPVPCAGNCVMNGTSWKTTKGTNVNLLDNGWYSVDIVFVMDTPKSNYFVRVFALDANYSYLGFGSSATSANLTNTAAQNHFFVDSWSAFKSSGVGGTQVRDIQNGAWGCSLLAVACGTFWVLWEVHTGRKKKAINTEVFKDEAATKN